MPKYLIVIEKTAHNYSAYSPDLPGCVASGRSRREVGKNMQEAIRLHVRGLERDRQPIPEPRSFAEYVTVA